jgi:GH25 family lysozyme M1 (1,4-beta-N-acetylmuramidase)
MPTTVEAVKGVDLQGLASEENLACIRDGEEGKGGQFVVFRAWLGNNTFNPYTN